MKLCASQIISTLGQPKKMKMVYPTAEEGFTYMEYNTVSIRLYDHKATVMKNKKVYRYEHSSRDITKLFDCINVSNNPFTDFFSQKAVK